MKHISKKDILLVLLTMLLTCSLSYAQIEELGMLMAAGKADAQTLLQPYITPAVNAFGASLGGGWYNTAEAHKLGGFDLTFTVNAAIIPKKYETFEIDNAALNYLKLADPNDNVAQTVAGEKTYGPQIVYAVGGYTEPAFSMPRGMNTNFVPAPMLQAGIGLIKGTEVLVRYLPTFRVRGNEIGLWGLGGKHDIKQWIPGLKKLPVLQVSVMYGYTRLHTFVAMNIDKGTINAGSLPGEESNTWDDQFMKLVVQSQTANLLFSANLPVVCFYGGLGFVSTKTNLKFTGDYPVVYLDGATPSVMAVSDPIDISVKNQDGGITKPRLNAGVRFKLAVVTIHFDYSWANYSVLTAGLGITFR